MKYYVVWNGRKKGIFDNWPDCASSVNGYSGARFKSFLTLIDAEEAYANVPAATMFSVLSTNRVHSYTGGICVDAACSNNGKQFGQVWWRGVENQVEVFTGGPITGTNNIGEFLAICDGLRLSDKNIWSDSAIAIKWATNAHYQTKFRINSDVRGLLDTAVQWLKTHEYKHRVFFWDNKKWGENPADYGRK